MGGSMLRKLLASTGLVVFALFGCEDHMFFAEPAAAMQVIYLNGEPDHRIVEAAKAVGTQLTPLRDNAEPAIANGR